MKTPTSEELLRPRTPEEADAAIKHISAGTVRRCIPAQVDDDDLVLGAVVEEWKRLRAALASPPAPAEGEREAGFREGLEAARRQVLTRSPDVIVGVLNEMLANLPAPRPPSSPPCHCTHEAGDSPCPLHGMEEPEPPPPGPKAPVIRNLTRPPSSPDPESPTRKLGRLLDEAGLKVEIHPEEIAAPAPSPDPGARPEAEGAKCCACPDPRAPSPCPCLHHARAAYSTSGGLESPAPSPAAVEAPPAAEEPQREAQKCRCFHGVTLDEGAFKVVEGLFHSVAGCYAVPIPAAPPQTKEGTDAP